MFGERVFCRRDAVRYNGYLVECAEALQSGDRRGPAVHAGCVLPHHVAGAAVAAVGTDNLQPDLQWADIVSRVKSARDARRVLCGSEANIIPVCDVSGSMEGRPMDVAVSLSLLLAESASRGSPEFGRIITFSESPSIVAIDGVPDYDAGGGIVAGGLAGRIGQVTGMDCGMSTNVEATFELILYICLRVGVSDAQARNIVVLVLSDMEFDQCRCLPLDAGPMLRGHALAAAPPLLLLTPAHVRRGDESVPWETTHEAITSRWRDGGYSSPPKIVYWNLRGSGIGPKGSSPVMSSQPGVACVSGFSPSILEAILDGALCDDEGFTPESIMRLALDRPCYARILIPA